MRLSRTTHTGQPSASRRSAKAMLSAMLIGSSVLFAAAPVAAAAAPVGLDFNPHTAAAQLHSGAASPVKFATSTNWAGYAAHSTKYTSVTATWVEPGASCGSSTSYAAFWTGLDGYASSSVEQDGTLVECSGGVAYQFAWYEMYPAAPVYFNNSVSKGDTIVSRVTSTSTGAFTLYLADTTKGWSHTINQTNSSLARSSAEVIAEAPSSSSGVLPLANFGTVTFNGCDVNGGTLAASGPTAITMVTSSGTTKASVSAISSSGTSFSATWHHA
jgi:hypothetical protein